jgi:hypothetical protein
MVGCRFGNSIAAAGDVDGDGIGDLIIGSDAMAGASGVMTTTPVPSIVVYSCRTRTPLYKLSEKSTTDGQSYYGTLVRTVSDLDKDGVSDLLVSDPVGNVGEGSGSGSIWVYSGRTGSPIKRLTEQGTASGGFGWSVAAIGDVNDDNISDIAIGCPYPSTDKGIVASVGLFSGKTFALIETLRAPKDVQEFGWVVSGVGDLDMDGVGDIAVSAGSGQKDRSVYIYSGRQKTMIYRIGPAGDSGSFGASIEGVGDLDDDGVGDIAIGSPRENADDKEGRVFLHSGKMGTVLRECRGKRHSPFFGAAIARLADVSGDNKPDIVIGIPGGRTEKGRVVVIDSSDGSQIMEIEGTRAGGEFGLSLASLGDVNNDGQLEVAIGEPEDQAEHVGNRVHWGDVWVISIPVHKK